MSGMTTVSFPAPERGSLAVVVGGNVRALMAVRKVSQMQMATILGVTQSAVSKRLRGVTPFDTDDLQAIGEAFDVEPMHLLDPQFSPGTGRKPFVTVGYLGRHRPHWRSQLGALRPDLRMIPPLPATG